MTAVYKTFTHTVICLLSLYLNPEAEADNPGLALVHLCYGCVCVCVCVCVCAISPC